MMRISHKARFERYRDDSVIQKCIRYAHWTIPGLMADLSTVQNGTNLILERDYQEIGALLTNNLAPKLAGLLFPASRPFFRAGATQELEDRATEAGLSKSEVAAAFAKMEQEASARVFLNAGYAQIIQALRHLIVTGNVMTHRDSKAGKFTAFGLQSFSQRRDGQGNMIDAVLREYTHIESLEPNIQQALRIAGGHRYRNTDTAPAVQLFTRIHRKMGASGKFYYEVSQEADETPVGVTGQYPEHLCPWQVITWSLIAGENNGRGLVEDYAGGFAKLSDASHAAALYGIEMMKVLNLVQPGLGADIDELAKAESGEYVQGTPGAVVAYENGDANKLLALRAEINDVFSNLSRAFMYKGNTRDAERVTAFELKQDALEADNTLGGNYSSLSAAMQIPYAHILLTEVDEDVLEGLLTKTIQLEIIAGIPALGRAVDVQNLLQAATDGIAIVQQLMQFDKRVDPLKAADIIYAAYSVDTSLLFKSKEQMAAEADAAMQEQQGQQQMMDAAAAADASQTMQTL